MFEEPNPNAPRPEQGNQSTQQQQGQPQQPQQTQQRIGRSQIEQAFTHKNMEPRVREYIRQLGSRSFIARREAAERLGRIGHSAEKAVDTLKNALNDDHDGVRMEAAKALGLIGDTSAIESLRESMRNDRAGQVRDNAKTALHALEGAKQMEHELKLLDEERGRIEQEKNGQQE